MEIRLVVDGPLGGGDSPGSAGAGNGAWNMAVDEILLSGAAANGRPTLRFYGWSVPTVSLGYFQQAADRGNHAASRDCPWVRRASGGGAIVHDRELTYSFTQPESRAERGASVRLYQAFHDGLIEALSDWGIKAACYARSSESSSPDWLCFQRRTSTDVLIGASKICGSAQRRHEGGLLQHGSVLLATSAAAPELPGIAELTGKRVAADELCEAWTSRLAGRLAAQFSRESLTSVESWKAGRIQFERFENPDWNEKR